MNQKTNNAEIDQTELFEKAKAHGYVFVRTESGSVAKDDVDESGTKTVWYHVFLNQNTYGELWAFTEAELPKPEKN